MVRIGPMVQIRTTMPAMLLKLSNWQRAAILGSLFLIYPYPSSKEPYLGTGGLADHAELDFLGPAAWDGEWSGQVRGAYLEIKLLF